MPKYSFENLAKTIFSPPFVFFTGKVVFSESVKDYLGIRNKILYDNEKHIEAAVNWLCRAQDATPDGGVSRSYSIIWHPFFKTLGWLSSYPETTGYIIPTFFDYYHITRNKKIFNRAIRMADWECSIQMASGGFMGGMVHYKPIESVFNTGQIIFGLCRTFLETDDGKYIDAARRAGDFLIFSQDIDGAWVKASPNPPMNVYNTRTSWALALLDTILENGKYRYAAIKNIKWALSKQNRNGWFHENCLNDPKNPLVHTIGYAVQGIFETGLLVEDGNFIEQAAKTANVMAGLIRTDGSLAGRYNKDWKEAVSWSCNTGNSQMSIVWSRMHQKGILTGINKAAEKINAFNKSVQKLEKSANVTEGGMKGSYPIYGDYGRFEYLNWAAKFHIDALLLEERDRKNKKILGAEKRNVKLFWGS